MKSNDRLDQAQADAVAFVGMIGGQTATATAEHRAASGGRDPGAMIENADCLDIVAAGAEPAPR